MFNADTTSPTGNTSTIPGTQPGTPAGQITYPFRLLDDEVVLGTFPIARKDRLLGKLGSFIFVTDSRVIYSAEAKSLASSSTHSKEYKVSTIEGVEVNRHRGFDAISAASAIGVVLNFIGLLIITGLIAAASGGGGGYGSSIGYLMLGVAVSLLPITVFLAVATLTVGGIAVFIMRRPRAGISIVGPKSTRALAEQRDLPAVFMKILLFVIFGLFAAFAVIAWALLRELGIFKAEDAQSFADTQNIDRIHYELGALILDVQARGKLAGK